ncbi:MAG: hypothetical protein P4L61_01320 [Candidatus Pacebacteria bacterium]|nr:hypothetical protein [Candidatus Paceibacterota bacterium]
MSDTLTESVARLHRAGSEYSQQTQKLRKAVDDLLKWMRENLPPEFKLPCGCKLWPSGEFVQHHPDCSDFDDIHNQLFKVSLGEKHTLHQLTHFSKLIAEGFLEKLCEKMEAESRRLEPVTEQIQAFLSAKKK